MIARGETLVEVTVSVVLLAVGALALAAGIGRAGVDRREALEAARMRIEAESWIERWRPGSIEPGDAEGVGETALGAPSGTLSWTVRAVSPCLLEATVEVVAGIRRAPVRLATRRFVGSECPGGT